MQAGLPGFKANFNHSLKEWGWALDSMLCKFKAAMYFGSVDHSNKYLTKQWQVISLHLG